MAVDVVQSAADAMLGMGYPTDWGPHSVGHARLHAKA